MVTFAHDPHVLHFLLSCFPVPTMASHPPPFVQLKSGLHPCWDLRAKHTGLRMVPPALDGGCSMAFSNSSKQPLKESSSMTLKTSTNIAWNLRRCFGLNQSKISSTRHHHVPMSSSWLSASLVLSSARDVVQLRMLLNAQRYFVRSHGRAYVLRHRCRARS